MKFWAKRFYFRVVTVVNPYLLLCKASRFSERDFFGNISFLKVAVSLTLPAVMSGMISTTEVVLPRHGTENTDHDNHNRNYHGALAQADKTKYIRTTRLLDADSKFRFLPHRNTNLSH